MPGEHSFEAFVEASAEAKTVERLYELLLAAMLYFGFDQLNFSVQRDQALASHHQGFGLISTYPTAWQAFYRDRGFVGIDPVVRWASSAFRPFRWRDIERQSELSRQQITFLRKADAAGLHHGIGIPFTGPSLQIAGIALATSERRISRAVSLDLLAAYCNQFYKDYKRIVGAEPPVPPPLVTLSHREQEVMVRVAHGRSNEQIAEALGIGADTIDYYIRSVFRKLNVHSRVAAATLCLQYGLIEL